MGSIAESTAVTNGHRPTVEELKLQLKNAANGSILKAPLPNPSLQVTADHNLKTLDAPVYAPKAGEVLLHIKCTGICGYEREHLGWTIEYLIANIHKDQTFTFGRPGG